MLTWRGLAVALPLHWHCSRNGTGDNCECWPHRPRAGCHRRALRCSCGTSALPAGHRSVPSAWRGKLVPVKWPADPWRSQWQEEHIPRREGRSEASVRTRAMAGGQEQTRWCALLQGQADALIRVEYSRSTGSQFARFPVPRLSEDTNDLDHARCLHLLKQFQRRRDASTGTPHRRQ